MAVRHSDSQLPQATTADPCELVEALQDTASALFSTLELNQILDRILANIASVIPFQCANIMLVEGGLTQVVRAQGYSPEAEKKLFDTFHYSPPDFLTFRHMLETGKPIVIADTRSDPRWRDLHVSDWIRAYMGAPIRLNREVRGFINLNSPHAAVYTSTHSDHLQLFANQAAIAIEHTRMVGDIQRFTQQIWLLNELGRAAVDTRDLAHMGQRFADRFAELLGADGAYITLYDEQRRQSICLAACGSFRNLGDEFLPGAPDEKLTRLIFKAGRPLPIEDVSTHPQINGRLRERFPGCSALGLPLAADGQNLGAAFVTFADSHEFTPEEMALAEQAASQMAMGIYKLQLLESECQRSRQLYRANEMILALSRVASHLQTATSREQVLGTLGAELSKLNMKCLVALDGNGEARPEAGLQLAYISEDLRLEGAPCAEYRLDPGRFVYFEEVLVHQQAVYSSEPERTMITALAHLSARHIDELLRRFGITPQTQVIFLPLLNETQTTGMLWVWADDLQESDLPAASAFASQVSIALESARLYEEIRRLAVTDELTQLYNRRGFTEIGQREMERAVRFGRSLSAILFDIDLFKAINDCYGHIYGDKILQALAQTYRKNLRGVDVLGRWGGEEFALLLPETGVEAACVVAERLRRLAEEIEIPVENGDVIHITISLGIAPLNSEAKSLEALINQADLALYQAKRTGRNRLSVYGR